MFCGGEGIYGVATNGNSYAGINAAEAANLANSAKAVLEVVINRLVHQHGGHLASDMRSALRSELNAEFGKVAKQMMNNGKSASEVRELFRSSQVVARFKDLAQALSKASHGSQVVDSLKGFYEVVHETSGYRSLGQRVADGFRAAGHNASSALSSAKQSASALVNRARQFAPNARAALAGAGAGAVAAGQAAVTVGSMEVGAVASLGGGASAGGVTAAGAATVGGAVVLAGGVGIAIGTGIDYLPSLWGGRNLSDHVADGLLAIEEWVTGKSEEVEDVESQPDAPKEEVKEAPIICSTDDTESHVRN
jgi:hypothetical protein